jgi:CheY-like chemotaxis protein
MGKPQILMIEDNRADIELLRIALDGQGEPYDLIVLRDGEEALRYVRQLHQQEREPEPCVILLDLYLPKYDGLDVLRAIKQEPRLSDVNVVLLSSASVSKRDEAEILCLGAAIRLKPQHYSEVTELAAYVLELCRRLLVMG